MGGRELVSGEFVEVVGMLSEFTLRMVSLFRDGKFVVEKGGEIASEW